MLKHYFFDILSTCQHHKKHEIYSKERMKQFLIITINDCGIRRKNTKQINIKYIKIQTKFIMYIKIFYQTE